ncbi:AMP-binding protein [Lysinibacillus sp. NPDC093692]|uniref:AMP-binding protein n=1 Tax=Lysinibacillus sp. NPDC093692 TaxID=3390578 RepID=UPI003D0485A1
MKLVQILKKRAETQADHVAYIFLEDGESKENIITYSELYTKAKDIARYLQTKYKKGDKILIAMPSSIETIELIYGILIAEMIVIPCNTPGEITFNEKINSILQDTEISLIVVNSHSDSQQISMEFEKEIIVFNDLKIENTSDLFINEDSSTTAVIQYTSGSTSRPKGVIISNENINFNNINLEEHLKGNIGTIVTWLPIHHDMGLMGSLFFAMYCGEKCVVMTPSHFLRKPIRWLNAISTYKGVISASPNFGYKWCIEKISQEDLKNVNLSSWKIAINGSEPIDDLVIKEFNEKFKETGFTYNSWMPCYGMAEATLFISGIEPKENPNIINVLTSSLKNESLKISSSNTIQNTKFVSAGIPKIETKIINPNNDFLEELELGEIVIKGNNVFNGYINYKDKDMWIDGFFKTGDMGFFYKKQLYITGRKKDMIILHGVNYYPEDIEKQVTQTITELKNYRNVCFSITSHGEEKVVFIQEVLKKDKENFDEFTNKIRETINNKYGIDINKILLVRKNSLLKTSSGKIKRKAIKQLFEEDKINYLYEGIIHASHNIKQNLNDFVSELLDYPIEKIDLSEPLVSYGLNSIKLAQLAEYIYMNWSKELDSTKILNITLNDLLDLKGENSNFYKVPEKFRLAKNLESIWFQSEVKKNSYYSLNSLFIVKNLNKLALEDAINRLIMRHPMLRSGYHSGQSNIHGYIKEKINFQIVDVNVNNEIEFEKFLKKEVNTRIDLNKPPLLKVIYIKTDKNNYLLFRIHHIITDFWSLSLLYSEIKEIYERKEESLDFGIDEFYVNESKGIDHIDSDKEKFFRNYFNKIKPLKLDIERNNNENTFNFMLEKNILDSNMSKRIKNFCLQNNVSENIVFLSVFIILLNRYTHQKDISLAIPYHGRVSPKSYRSQGNFVKTIPINFELKNEMNFLDIIAGVNNEYLRMISEFSANQGSAYNNYLINNNKAFETNILFTYRDLPKLKNLNRLNLNNTFEIGNTQLKLIRREELEKESIYNIDFLIEQDTDHYFIWLKYNNCLYETDKIKKFINHFLILFNKLIHNEEKSISNFSLLEDNSEILLKKDSFESNTTIKKELINQFEKNANNIAASFNTKEISYEFLYERAKKLASILKKL